ncbi:MAG: hypothetical protein ACFFD2_14990 [Promethearchaeota archaeon]
MDEIKDGMLIQVKKLLRKLELEPFCGEFFKWNDETLLEDLSIYPSILFSMKDIVRNCRNARIFRCGYGYNSPVIPYNDFNYHTAIVGAIDIKEASNIAMIEFLRDFLLENEDLDYEDLNESFYYILENVGPTEDLESFLRKEISQSIEKGFPYDIVDCGDNCYDFDSNNLEEELLNYYLLYQNYGIWFDSKLGDLGWDDLINLVIEDYLGRGITFRELKNELHITDTKLNSSITNLLKKNYIAEIGGFYLAREYNEKSSMKESEIFRDLNIEEFHEAKIQLQLKKLKQEQEEWLEETIKNYRDKKEVKPLDEEDESLNYRGVLSSSEFPEDIKIYSISEDIKIKEDIKKTILSIIKEETRLKKGISLKDIIEFASDLQLGPKNEIINFLEELKENGIIYLKKKKFYFDNMNFK